METRRWTNPGQPQTMQIAVFLLYISAAFNVLTLFRFGVLHPVFIAVIVAQVAGGFGIANERRWGYWLGVAAAASPFVIRVLFAGVDAILATNILNLIFEIALLALLLHPHTREYQRVWFH